MRILFEHACAELTTQDETTDVHSHTPVDIDFKSRYRRASIGSHQRIGGTGQPRRTGGHMRYGSVTDEMRPRGDWSIEYFIHNLA